MPEPRDHAKYQYVDKNGWIIHSGITKRDLDTRGSELRRDTGRNGSTRQVGRPTKSAALDWERRQRKGTPPGGR